MTSDLESNRIIGENQALKALELFQQGTPLTAVQLDYTQLYWDITKSVVTDKFGNQARTCYPAMVSTMNKLKHMY